ncbi:MAG: hypothetical protein SFU86_11815 [Pirellulaceae bacterium]|nr:hypothetical protein [Pirellulaceae bacterium]
MSEPSSPSPLRLSIERRPTENRLSIAHLLLWMTATALVIAAVEPPEERPAPASKSAKLQSWVRQSAPKILVLLIAPLAGMGLAAQVLSIWRGYRLQEFFPSQPGHWLLMLIGRLTALVVFVGFGWRIANSFDLPELMPLLNGVLMVAFLILALGWLAQVIGDVREPWHWHLVFRIFAWWLLVGVLLPSCLAELSPAFAVFSIALIVTPPAVVVWAAGCDLHQRLPCDIFHWCGIGAFLGIWAILVALPIVSILWL